VHLIGFTIEKSVSFNFNPVHTFRDNLGCSKSFSKQETGFSLRFFGYASLFLSPENSANLTEYFVAIFNIFVHLQKFFHSLGFELKTGQILRTVRRRILCVHVNSFCSVVVATYDHVPGELRY